jgi:uncharacterized protein YgbK (DUF1537 family)
MRFALCGEVRPLTLASDAYEWNDGLVDPAEPLRIPGARQAIRDSHQRSGRRLLVLDDDPTGSQAVHGVEVVMAPDSNLIPMDTDLIAAALTAPGSTCFVLTNSRSRSEAEAAGRARELAGVAAQLEQSLGGRIEVVSRSDSTLRGHVLAEIRALAATRQEGRGQRGQEGRGQEGRGQEGRGQEGRGQEWGGRGRGYDGVLLVPSYLEAGRITASDIHWARVGGRFIPVGQTEFARDATFGYVNSDLRRFLEEKSDGAIAARDVQSISLHDVRRGGPERVRQILLGVHDGGFVVVNSVDYADLEVVVLGLLAAEEAGHAFLYRVGPSFVQVLAGLDPMAPLDASRIWPDGRPDGHGLVVVGSHVGLTNRQVDVLEASRDVARVPVNVDALLGPGEADQVVRDCVAAARRALATRDVLLITSRTLRTGGDGEESLRIARMVSAGLVAIVRELLADHPAWVITKGGITSHDVLDAGLGIRRAQVAGQLFAGFVSVFRPLEARPEAIGMPCVVFAGNVGGDSTLADAVGILQGPSC